MVTVNLNSSMRSNLLSLQSIAELQAISQNRLANGRKINSAIDNPSSYYTSVSLNNRAKDLSQLLDAMSQGIQTLKAVSETLSTGLDLLMQAQAVAKSALETAPVVLDRYWYEQQKNVSFVVENARELKAAVNSGKTGDIVVLGNINLDEEIKLQSGQNLVGIGYFSGINSQAKDTVTDKYSAITYQNEDALIVVDGDKSTIADISIKANGVESGIRVLRGNANIQNVDIQNVKLYGIFSHGEVNISGENRISGQSEGVGILSTSINILSDTKINLSNFINGIFKLGVYDDAINIADRVEIISQIKERVFVGGVSAGKNLLLDVTTSQTAFTSAQTFQAGDDFMLKIKSTAEIVIGASNFILGNNAKILIDNYSTNDYDSSLSVVNITAGDNFYLSVYNAYNGSVANSFTLNSGDNAVVNLTSGKKSGGLFSNSTLNLGNHAEINLDNVTLESSSSIKSGNETKFNVNLKDENQHAVISFVKDITFGKNSILNIAAKNSYLIDSPTNHITFSDSKLNFEGKGLTTSGATLSFINSVIDAELTDLVGSNGSTINLDNTVLNISSHVNNSGFINNAHKLNIKNNSTVNAVVYGDNNNLIREGAIFSLSADSKFNLKSVGNGNNLFDYGARHNTEIGAEFSYNDKKYIAIKAGEAEFYQNETDMPNSEYFQETASRSMLRSSAMRLTESDESLSAMSVMNKNSFGAMPKVVAAIEDETGDVNTGVADSSRRFNEILRQFDQLVNDSGYKGINLLRGDDLQITFNETHSSKLNIKGINALSEGLGMIFRDWEHSSHINRSLDELEKAIAAIRSYSVQFGNYYSVVTEREDFTTQLINVLTEGADKLSLADMNEESANMLALETRQLLAINSLSLASQASQSILRLF